MVHLDKVQGQRGHMIVQEDGTIISSSGELASNEMTSQQITTLIAHSFPVNFSASASSGNGDGTTADRRRPSFNAAETVANGAGIPSAGGDGKSFKWNRITVNFGDKSYVACLSNRKVHLVKRDHGEHNSV